MYAHSFIIPFMVSEDTWLNENSILILNFFFIAFMLRWKTNFLRMALIVSFPDDIEVSWGQLKRFNESVIDPECLLKISAISFCLITFYPFQATYFLVYYYFYLISTVYMFSKMVRNYNQYWVSQITTIGLIYSYFPTGFVT